MRTDPGAHPYRKGEEREVLLESEAWTEPTGKSLSHNWLPWHTETCSGSHPLAIVHIVAQTRAGYGPPVIIRKFIRRASLSSFRDEMRRLEEGPRPAFWLLTRVTDEDPAGGGPLFPRKMRHLTSV